MTNYKWQASNKLKSKKLKVKIINDLQAEHVTPLVLERACPDEKSGGRG